MNKDTLLQLVRDNGNMTLGNQISLVAQLSFPAILAQLSIIIMQYIDASMVGSLGARASASIGIVSTTIWLFGGLCTSASTGFYVQVAHLIGGKNYAGARDVLRQSISTTLLFAFVLMAIGLGISPYLPIWLGGETAICKDASFYFTIYAATLPFIQLKSLAGGMLRSSGNVKVPSMLNILMCVLDVLFNYLLIFPTQHYTLGGMHIAIPGADMGVEGAAIATMISVIITCILMWLFLIFRCKELSLMYNEDKDYDGYIPKIHNVRMWLKISLPMGIEHALMCCAQIMSTIIVAPLGTASIAANSFGITVEALCYLPGYGIAEAATTLVGQSLGAQRESLANRFAVITISAGMIIMTLTGIIMYIYAPEIISVMTPDMEVQTLAINALRIEAWAEPMFAASIVAYGVFVGRKAVYYPCLLNLFSIWAIRIPLAWYLSKDYGLSGVWFAMCIELCFRGFNSLVLLKIKPARIPLGKFRKR